MCLVVCFMLLLVVCCHLANKDIYIMSLSVVGLLRHAPVIHGVKRRHRVYGHDTIAILWVQHDIMR